MYKIYIHLTVTVGKSVSLLKRIHVVSSKLSNSIMNDRLHEISSFLVWADSSEIHWTLEHFYPYLFCRKHKRKLFLVDKDACDRSKHTIIFQSFQPIKWRNPDDEFVLVTIRMLLFYYKLLNFFNLNLFSRLIQITNIIILASYFHNVSAILRTFSGSLSV